MTTKAELVLRVSELEAALAAATARLQIATQVYKNQKALIRELESKLNTRGVKPVAQTQRVIEFTKRDGTRWTKTICGNRAVIARAA